MRIIGKDNRCWLSIEHWGDDGYSAFEIEAHVEIGHGEFHSKNIDVQLLKLGEFVSEFNRFIMDRSLSPRLEGTYDSHICFREVGVEVVLEFAIGDATTIGNNTIFYRQTGAFIVDQEYLTETFRSFRSLSPILKSPSTGD